MIYLELFVNFFIIGLFTFGGGYAMIPLIQDAVIKHNWMNINEFIDLIGVCESTPGPIAVNMATYIGSTQAGILGSLVSVIGVVLPSFIIIILVATLLKKVINNKYFKNIMNGIKPVVLSLIFSTGIALFIKVIGFNSIKSFNLNIESIVIIVILVLIEIFYRLIKKKSLGAISLILIAAVVGLNVCLLI